MANTQNECTTQSTLEVTKLDIEFIDKTKIIQILINNS